METVLWTTLCAILVALAAGYVHPSSRPYVRKYGWLLVVPVAFLLGAVLFSRKKPDRVDGRRVEDVGGTSKETMSTLVDVALAQVADADAELARRRLEEMVVREEASLDLADYEARLSEARAIEDASKRRRALVDLVERTRR